MSATTDIQVRPIIGLEIHVQLATKTKMFCSCPIDFGGEPNSRVCPVCMGMPGTLPVINRQAVEYSILLGMAVGCEIPGFTKWDRKSYYYPDLPKNYQISQYDLPLCKNGHFDLQVDGALKRIRILRAHLEEDAGKNLHEGLDHTRVDLNRAGTALLEIVTEPDIAGADEAYEFCVELQRLVRWLGISEADMQKGHMRFEPNINVAITDADGKEYRTPIIEIKNLNSFRSVRNAIAYEIGRQVDEWRADHSYTLAKYGKENRGWDDDRGVSEFQRGKEEAHDYRYFPDPDLVPVVPDEAWLKSIRESMPELPLARQKRYMEALNLSLAEAVQIVTDRATADLYEAAIAVGGDARTLAREFVSFWSMHANARQCTIAGLGIDAERMGQLSSMVAKSTINATAAAAIAEKMLTSPDGPQQIAEQENLIQTSDAGALEKVVDEAMAANPNAVECAKPGHKKEKASFGFLMGAVMKASGGKANPKVVQEILAKKLKALYGQ
jgi:aspartyl-tRNA(Asn)/glutamyl-tRNA(Gln) amidotransferase subunit B